jgi:hypothetical protein
MTRDKAAGQDQKKDAAGEEFCKAVEHGPSTRVMSPPAFQRGRQKVRPLLAQDPLHSI